MSFRAGSAATASPPNRKDVPLKLRRQRVHMIASRLHKWLALIIGFQLILWFSSGALMSFLSIDKVHGDHLVDRKTVTAIPQSVPLADVSTVLRGAGGDAESVTVRVVLGRPVFEVATKSGNKLFDGATGSALPFVTAAQAKTIADKAWIGAGHPSSKLLAVNFNFTATDREMRREVRLGLSVRLSRGKRSLLGQIVVILQRRLALAKPYAAPAKENQCN